MLLNSLRVKPFIKKIIEDNIYEGTYEISICQIMSQNNLISI